MSNQDSLKTEDLFIEDTTKPKKGLRRVTPTVIAANTTKFASNAIKTTKYNM